MAPSLRLPALRSGRRPMAGAIVEGPRGGGGLRDADNGATAAALGHIHEAPLDLVRKKLEEGGRGSREEETEEGGGGAAVPGGRSAIACYTRRRGRDAIASRWRGRRCLASGVASNAGGKGGDRLIFLLTWGPCMESSPVPYIVLVLTDDV